MFITPEMQSRLTLAGLEPADIELVASWQPDQSTSLFGEDAKILTTVVEKLRELLASSASNPDELATWANQLHRLLQSNCSSVVEPAHPHYQD